MKYVNVRDAKRQLPRMLQDVQHEAVTIREEQKDIAVVLSADEYARLTSTNIQSFNDFCDEVGRRAAARGLTEQKLQCILND